jgi:hypothetical protein
VAVLTREARKRLERPLLTFLLSLVIAVCLGVVVYMVTTTLPYLASSPTTDPNFGNLNHCLLSALPSDRTGFAVLGTEVAGYSGKRLVLCKGQGPGAVHEVSGVTHASFDRTGALWYSRRAEPDQPPELWRIFNERSERIGEIAPIGLVGTDFGVVTIDAVGRLVSLNGERTVLGVAQLPIAPPADVQLTTSADGHRVAVVTSGGLFVYDAQRLAQILAEAPCAVEFLWWRKEGHRALLSCAPDASWALELDVDSGAREAAPKLKRSPSVLEIGHSIYVQECEQLPCTASAP